MDASGVSGGESTAINGGHCSINCKFTFMSGLVWNAHFPLSNQFPMEKKKLSRLRTFSCWLGMCKYALNSVDVFIIHTSYIFRLNLWWSSFAAVLNLCTLGMFHNCACSAFVFECMCEFDCVTCMFWVSRCCCVCSLSWGRWRGIMAVSHWSLMPTGKNNYIPYSTD